MKKIRSIRQLQAEKKRIQQHQEELERKIRGNWKDLKDCLNPANVAKEALNKVIRNKTEDNMNGDSILKNTFTYGVSLLAKRFAEKAAGKVSSIFRK